MATLRAAVTIHGGDYDCSELVRMCWRAAGVLPYGSYMWTGNELELLRSKGFREHDRFDPKAGDVLWRDGHTELYLGDGLQGGARIAETGGIDGAMGDQTGTEVTRGPYRPNRWTKLLRYEGDHKVDGIPAAVVAVQVANHIIDHEAHGYSQPHRSGDGTIETITITWEDGKEMTEAEWTRMAKLIDARLDAKMAQVPARVWGFRNKDLEARDCYQILRDIRTTLGVEDGQTLTTRCVTFGEGVIARLCAALGVTLGA